MAGDEGVGKSTETEGQPLGAHTPVFVSYASQDAAVAHAIVENLEQHGIHCWIAPRDVTPGSQYADEIVGAINDTEVLVLVLSEHAVASAHVGREIERAASKRRRIIVLRTDAAPLTRSFEYFLSESQWIDVAALGVPAALTKLTQAVGQRLAPSSWVSPGLGTDVRDPADRKHKPSYLTIKRAVAAAVFLIVTALVVGIVVRYWPSKQEGAQTPVVAAISDKSIAVLPFVDMSEKKDQEYFADGMAEEIIDLLVKIPGLKVIGRTSSFQFKGRTQDLRTIGKQLGVAYVLEGSVRKSGDRLRVTAQLIDAQDGTHLFSQNYERELSDVLKMQDEIADTLVRALQIEVSPEGIASRPALRNTDAYTLYLQGQHAFDRFDQQGFEQAASYFQQALDLDPAFAVGASKLATAYMVLGEWGFMPPAVAFEPARRAEELALKLDPNLADAHAGLARIHGVYDWDWSAADRELKLAQALAPNDARILFMSALQSLSTGRWDEALKLINASLAQDPLNPSGYFVLYQVQLRRGRSAEAEAAIRRTLAISPTFSRAHFYLGRVLLARNQPEAALTEMQKEGDDATRLGGSAMACFNLRRKADSDAALAQMLKDQANHNPFYIAQVYAFRGESDEAFKWLDRAYEQKDVGLSHIKGDVPFKTLEGDPRYKAFLKKMNLPE
jgi:TolB-like protein/Tfp pilus assembly protein PilF